jgi:uncharacterized damage-inducible protein DinB
MSPSATGQHSPKKPEVWLRGPIEGIPLMLQPIAHALLQATEEVEFVMNDFPESLLWQRPATVASAGFHLKHLKGVLDRLFTYAKGLSLNEEQLQHLKDEGSEKGNTKLLLEAFKTQVEESITYLSKMNEQDLFAFRGVGRAQIPSNVFGLLVHAAEHTMRHVGQLLVTARILKSQAERR